jgi:superfamily II DNA/RNA helicase
LSQTSHKKYFANVRASLIFYYYIPAPAIIFCVLIQKEEKMNFAELSLHPSILKAVEEAGYTSPTPIQQQAIPQVLAGCDIRASAQTGTGKTAAFILPALHRLLSQPSRPGRGPRILVLAPTRELAMQIAAETARYSARLQKTKTVCIYGGVPYPVQMRDLARPYEILVATPGRLIDFMDRKRILLDRIELLVLDEADRMLDMGFIKPVEQIAAATPKERQTLMFSATLKGPVMGLSNRLLRNPLEITIDDALLDSDSIEQRLYNVDNLQHKQSLLEHLLTDSTIHQAIVFTATKRHADELTKSLCEIGHSAAALHGDMNQRQRTRTIKRLRAGEIRVLVATDVAARGIDHLGISHVINFDLPMAVEDYIHRIGRTGRAGGKGVALSFAANKDRSLVRQIERRMNCSLTVHTVPGMEPKGGSSSYSPRPYGQRRGGSNSRYGRLPPRRAAASRFRR